ncbi:AI-2E family transporter [archaeon]|nr:AI-2E family transporter [archaeon]
MADEKIISKVIALVVIALIFIAALIVIKPIIIAIIVGLIFAYVFHPLYRRLRKVIKSPNLATIILMVLIITALAIPVWFIAPIFIKQTFETYRYLQQINFAEAIRGVLPQLFSAETAGAMAIHINNFLASFFSSLMSQLTNMISNIPNLILKFVAAVFTFFFATRDASKLKEYLHSLSPFPQKTGEKFLKEFRNITDAIVYGQVAIGLIQGLVLGVGLFLLGAPSPILLTTLAAIFSVVPILGSWLVWLPTGALMIASGKTVTGVILLIYGAVFVSTIDNFLRPYFLSKKSTLPISVALVGTIGGFYTFGLIGLVLGPLILAYSLIVLDFYRKGNLKDLFKN